MIFYRPRYCSVFNSIFVIFNRVRVLVDHKEQQQTDLDECTDIRNKLTDKAGELAEKYEDAAERQRKITERFVKKVKLNTF